MRSLPALALVLALPLACATISGERPALTDAAPTLSNVPEHAVRADAAFDVDALRLRMEGLLRQQGQTLWRQWVFGEPPADEVDEAEDLFTPAVVSALRKARLAAPDRARQLELMELYVAGEVIARATAEVDERIAAIEAESFVTVGEERVPFRDLDRVIAHEPSAEQRAIMARAEKPVLEQLRPLYAQRQARAEETVRALGYDSQAAFAGRLRGSDLRTLARLADRTLDATEALYRDVMTSLARDELATSLDDLRRTDIPRLFRVERSDGAFPGRRLVATSTELLEGLGLDLARTGLTLDVASRQGKSARPLCLPVNAPDDVRLSVRPAGGADEYRLFLHELAHAQHYLHVTRPEWELRTLGEGAVHEGLAILFEAVVDTPVWLEDATPIRGATLRRFLLRSAAKRLYLVRRHAARLQFETALAGGTIADPRSAWRSMLSRALGFALTPEDADRYWLDRDAFLRSADYLRAELLGAQAESYLVARHGQRWWKSRQAGETLRALWSEGSAITVEAAAERLDAPQLGPEAFVDVLRRRLGLGDTQPQALEVSAARPVLAQTCRR